MHIYNLGVTIIYLSFPMFSKNEREKIVKAEHETKSLRKHAKLRGRKVKMTNT
jgi:hypothetical protein